MDIYYQITYLDLNPFLISYLFITGLFFGSFFNVLADRLSNDQTIFGRSKCDSCNHKLSWYDLLPIISFALLNRKCRYCKAPISIQYPFSEIFTAVIFVLTWTLSLQVYHSVYMHILNLVLASVFIVMLLSDIRYQIIPDQMQVLMFLCGLAKAFIIMFYPGNYTVEPNIWLYFQSLVGFISAGLVTMSPLLVIYLVTKGRGMGFGDVKLAFNMGLLLGLWPGLIAMYVGFVSGGFFGILLLLLRKGSRKTMIAFGPFLILGTYLTLFYENDLFLLVMKMYGMR